jgi:hypothetical protein
MKRLLHAILLLATLAANVYPQKNGDDDAIVLSHTRDIDGLRSIKRVAIFLTGDAQNETRLLQDAFAIGLRSLGWDVVDSIELQAAATRDFQSWWNSLEKTVREDPDKLEQHMRANWTTDKRFTANEEVISAQLASADALLTGTVLFGTHRYQGRLDKTDILAESQQTIVTNMSIQIISAKDGNARMVFEGVVGYRFGGKDIMNVVDSVRSVLQERLRPAGKGKP